jgi:hypothetical protein
VLRHVAKNFQAISTIVNLCRRLHATSLLYRNGTDDLLPNAMPIHRSAPHTRFFEESNVPDAVGCGSSPRAILMTKGSIKAMRRAPIVHDENDVAIDMQRVEPPRDNAGDP